jgi:hypothetical protein
MTVSRKAEVLINWKANQWSAEVGSPERYFAKNGKSPPG